MGLILNNDIEISTFLAVNTLTTDLNWGASLI